MNKPIVIIPARGGSKRIHRKNLKEFCGQPIIHFSIKAALESQLFSAVVVSTDDIEIAEVAKKEGAIVPFFRSEKNSNDNAGVLEVIDEVVTEYEKKFDIKITDLCCILPTAPMIQVSALKEAYELFKSKKYDSVFPVVKFSYPIFRSLQIEGGKASMFWPENYSKRSQDLPAAYHDVGQFYWINIKKCSALKRIFTENSGVIELSELCVQDIDTPEDWKIAELKFRLINEA